MVRTPRKPKKPTPRLDKLMHRIQKLTKAFGAKANLAKEIGVIPQQLNDWLSGSTEPGGEVTLRLLEWAAEEEAKQKCAGRGETRPARKAQTKTSKANESKSSGQQER